MDNLSQWCFQLSRSIYDSEIFNKPSDWFKVWIYILWKVNFKDNWLPRWSAYFKYEWIERDCKVKYNIVTKICKYLKEKNQIEVKKATHGCVITVVNYSLYQWVINYKSKTQATQRQDTGNTGVDNINKNERMEEWKNDILYNIQDFVDQRNSIKELRQNWKTVKWLPETRKITDRIQKARYKVSKEYTQEEIKNATNKYIEKIEKTIPNQNWDWTHRYTLFEFITRDKWLQNYINS